MNNSVIKDPAFPMRHAQVTELKNTAKIADLAKDADVLITRNGETIAYLVNPGHYEALISAWNELRMKEISNATDKSQIMDSRRLSPHG